MSSLRESQDGPESPRSRARRQKRSEWAEDTAKDTLAGQLWENVKQYETLEEQITALKQRLQCIEAEHREELAQVNERWSQQLEDEKAAHEQERIRIVDDFEAKLEAQAALAKEKEAKLNASISELATKLQQEQRSRAEVERELSQTKGDLKKASEKISQQAEVIQGLRAERDTLRSEITARAQQIERLKKDVSNLEGEMKSAKRTIAEMEIAQRELHNKLKVAMKQIEDDKKEMERIKREAEAKYAQLIEEIERITGQKVVVQDHLSVEKTATSRLKYEVDRLLSTIDTLKKIAEENELNKKKIKSLEDTIRERDTTIANLKQDCEKIKRDAELRFAELRRDIEQITGVKLKVEDELGSEKTVTSRLKDEMDRLLRTINDLKKIAEENERNKRKIVDLVDDVRNLKKKMEELMEEMRNQKTRAERELREQRSSYEEQLVTQKTRAEQELRAQRSSYEDQLATQKRDYEEQLREQKEYYEALLKELREQLHLLRFSAGHGKLRAMLARWKNLQCGCAMTEWCKYVEYKRAEKLFAQMLAKMGEKQREAAIRKMMYMLHAWSGNFKVLTFMDWKKLTLEGKQLDVKADYAAKKVHKMNMVYRFNSWKHNCKLLVIQRFEAQVKNYKTQLADCEEELERVSSEATLAAKSALNKYQLLQTEMSGVIASEESAQLSKDSAMRKLSGVEKSMAIQAQDARQALAGAKAKLPPLEKEIDRLEGELMLNRVDSQEEISRLGTKLRGVQKQLAARTKQCTEQELDLMGKAKLVAELEADKEMTSSKCSALERALRNADGKGASLVEEINSLQQQLKKEKQALARQYESGVLSTKKAEMFKLEKESMEGKIQTTLKEIEALRASWLSSIEETKLVRSENEALSARNNRLSYEFQNISIQLEEAMAEAARAQVKMLDVLQEVTLLRKDCDKAKSDLEMSEVQKTCLQGNLQQTFEKLKDTYMEVEQGKAQLHYMSERLSKANGKLEAVGFEKTRMETELRDEITTNENNIGILEQVRDTTEARLYQVTDSMVDAQRNWNRAEKQLDRMHTELIEHEQTVLSMQGYVGDMYQHQEGLVDDFDTLYATSRSSEFLSSRGNSQSQTDRLQATRYIGH